MAQKTAEQLQASFNEVKSRVTYNRVAIAALTFVGAGAVFYHLVEKFTWLDSFYFTVITLATVGYGDFVPKTAAGKLFTIFYVLVGISIFIVLARLIVSGIVIRTQARHDKRHNRHDS